MRIIVAHERIQFEKIVNINLSDKVKVMLLTVEEGRENILLLPGMFLWSQVKNKKNNLRYIRKKFHSKEKHRKHFCIVTTLVTLCINEVL